MSKNCMGVGYADDPLRGGGVIPRHAGDPCPYLNLEAIAHGTISGAFREWSLVKPEAAAVLRELAALREENARLIRERDEARAEVEAERAYADASNQDAIAAEAEVEQWKRNVDLTGAELRDAETAVARLEGLILAWDRECGPDELLEAEARRIRAQREEGRCSAGVKGCGILFDEHGHTEEGQ